MNPDYVKCTWKCFRSTHQQNKLIYSSTFVLLPRQGLLMNTQLLLLHVESFFILPHCTGWMKDNIGAKLFLHFMKAPPSSGQYSSWYPIRCTHHVIAITLVISGFAILQLTQANSRKQLASGAWQPTGFQFESHVWKRSCDCILWFVKLSIDCRSLHCHTV